MTVAASHPATQSWNFGRHVALSSGWFGFNFHWLPIGFILIQSQVRDLVPRGSEGTSIGVAVGLGGIFAVTVPPLVGYLSDRLNTPWGRRRPILAAGVVLNLVGLAVMGTATTYVQLVIGYLLIQLFNNAAGAAYAGIIPDVVRDEEFGKASGFLAAMNNLGGILGVGAALLMSSLHQIRLTYAVIGVVIVLAIIPVLWVSKGEGMNVVARRPHQPLAATVREFLAPLTHGDFAWVIFTRLMITAGINIVAYFLSPFFRDVVHVANPDSFTSTWLLVVFVAAIPFGFFGGTISDRYGRKPFVYGSGAFQGLVAVFFILVFTHNVVLVTALGAVYGLGYGLYYAVDWALACDTLPDRENPAKDMGLFHAAYTFPQVVVPLLGGLVLDAVNKQSAGGGYRAVFAISIVFFALGTFFVSRIRSVR